MKRKKYFVYILTNTFNTVFYTGFTDNLIKRVWQHREKLVEGFTKKYKLWKLVFYEEYTDPLTGIMREKQVKDYRREKKMKLMEKINPTWKDLYNDLLK